MECFRLLLEHLEWIEHQFLSGIRDSRKAGSLWEMMRGVGGVRKSIDRKRNRHLPEKRGFLVPKRNFLRSFYQLNWVDLLLPASSECTCWQSRRDFGRVASPSSSKTHDGFWTYNLQKIIPSCSSNALSRGAWLFLLFQENISPQNSLTPPKKIKQTWI